MSGWPGPRNRSLPAAPCIHPGFGRYRAIYNVTVAGNYSLEIMDALDGEHAVGSPYDVLVEPAQAFAPATIVWWDKQVRSCYTTYTPNCRNQGFVIEDRVESDYG